MVDLPTAFYVTAVRCRQQDPRPVREQGGVTDRFGRRASRRQSADAAVNKALLVAACERTLKRSSSCASEATGGAGLKVDRRSRLLDELRSGGEGRRKRRHRFASTSSFAGHRLRDHARAGLAAVRSQFFNWHEFKSTSRRSRARPLNIKIFCIAEAFILVFALFIAVLADLPGPVVSSRCGRSRYLWRPFRGIPTILVIAILGFALLRSA